MVLAAPVVDAWPLEAPTRRAERAFGLSTRDGASNRERLEAVALRQRPSTCRAGPADLRRDSPRLPGRLIIVEGIDGSGKSTQLDLLRKWLVNQGYLVIFSEWNSSPIVKGTTRRGKRQQLLSPMSFSLIHAADFASRTYSQIMPALQAGAIVLADRYVYTAYVARRGARRQSRLAATAVLVRGAADAGVLLRRAARRGDARISVGRPELKYYEAGLDLGLSRDPYESFRLFQGLIRQRVRAAWSASSAWSAWTPPRVWCSSSSACARSCGRTWRARCACRIRRLNDPLRVAGLLGHHQAERKAPCGADGVTAPRFYGEPPPGIAGRRICPGG